MKLKGITAFFAILSCVSCFGMPLNPELVERLRGEERLAKVVSFHKRAKLLGLDEPNLNPPKWDFGRAKVDQPAIVILVDFTDNVADTSLYPSSHYERMLFSVGSYPTGSMRDYYLETSYGKVDITGEATGWMRMTENYDYYTNDSYGFGSYPRNAQKLAEDAVLAADSLIDFSQFDADEDGYVDALFVVHAGPGAEATGSSGHIWSHMWFTRTPLSVDGVHVYEYSMEPEDGKIGVFAHELGHVFGLPDLYDYDYDSEGVGYWSIMASGSWAGGGTRPVHFDAWSKKSLGFLTPVTIATYLVDAPVPQAETDTTVYRLWTEGVDTTEYFLVENRRKTGFDQYLRGEGLLIYHVDEEVENNDNQEHYKVAVEQADGRFDLEENVNSGDGGDPFPGTTEKRLFDHTTTPNSNGYDGSETMVSVSNISDPDSVMTADLGAVLWIPRIEVVSFSVMDSAGNDDGRADPGEVVDFRVTVSNEALGASEVQGILSTDDLSVTLVQDSVTFPDLGTGETAENPLPFVFEVDSAAKTHWSTFALEIRAQPEDYTNIDTFDVLIGRPDILLVDDDAGEAYETYYEAPLCSLAILYDSWEMVGKGRIGEEIVRYPVVIWLTGDDSTNTLDTSDISDLSQFLDEGGSLFISGQNLGEDIGASPFYSDYLRAQWMGIASGDYFVNGVPGDEIADSLNLVILGAGGASNQTSQDVLSPAGGADSVFVYSRGGVAGVKSDGTYRVVYFGFGFEAVNDLVPGYAHRFECMQEILDWFGVEVGIEETSSTVTPRPDILTVNPNPSEGAIAVSYSIRKDSSVNINLYDASGRFIESLFEGFERRGFHTHSYSLSLPSGMYFLELRIGREMRCRGKFIIMR